MKSEHPKANAELIPLDRPFSSEIPRLRKVIEKRGLVGLANDTKWNEILVAMRDRSARWRPTYRWLCLDSERVSRWDGEWWHHLPFPFISVLWFDLSYREEVSIARLLAPQVIDHSADLESLLSRIGFDFEKGYEVIRIFGYAPRDYTEFNKNGAEPAATDNAV
jgi:hypothetical protein